MKLNHVAFVALAALSAGSAAAKDGMPWAKSFDDAKTIAAKEHKLVMVDFYTDW